MKFLRRGNSFRVNFSYLSRLRRLSCCPVVALTATATKTTMKIICERVGIVDPTYVVEPIDCSNLYFTFLTKKQSHEVGLIQSTLRVHSCKLYSISFLGYFAASLRRASKWRAEENDNFRSKKRNCDDLMGPPPHFSRSVHSSLVFGVQN